MCGEVALGWPPSRVGRSRAQRPRRLLLSVELVRALSVTWLFSGLRSDKIARLRTGCVRWQSSPEAPQDAVCLPARRAARSLSSWGRIAGALVLIATAGLHGLHVKREVDAEVTGADAFIPPLRAVGLALRERFPPGTTIALNPVGAVPYYSGFRAYDMLGVTDRHIARTSPRGLGTGWSGHEKGDGTYIPSA
jgi:hypothetical protein